MRNEQFNNNYDIYIITDVSQKVKELIDTPNLQFGQWKLCVTKWSDFLTVEECKKAFFEDMPVSFRRLRLKINCSHISALIYRKGPNGLELYCELKDRNAKCVYIVKHDKVLPGNDEERRIEVENEDNI